jgi:hypothetical protein
MDKDSPFASYFTPKKISHTGIVYVNFCNQCHYVWKAPTAAVNCVNCTNEKTAISLVNYVTECDQR